MASPPPTPSATPPDSPSLQAISVVPHHSRSVTSAYLDLRDSRPPSLRSPSPPQTFPQPPSDLECGLPPAIDVAFDQVPPRVRPLVDHLTSCGTVTALTGYTRSAFIAAIAHFLNVLRAQGGAGAVLVVTQSDVTAELWRSGLQRVVEEITVERLGTAKKSRENVERVLKGRRMPGVIVAPQKAVGEDGMRMMRTALNDNPHGIGWDLCVSDAVREGGLNSEWCPLRMLADRQAESAVVVVCKDDDKSRAVGKDEFIGSVERQTGRVRNLDVWWSKGRITERAKGGDRLAADARSEENVVECRERTLGKVLKGVENAPEREELPLKETLHEGNCSREQEDVMIQRRTCLKRMASMHNGALGVESECARGTRAGNSLEAERDSRAERKDDRSRKHRPYLAEELLSGVNGDYARSCPVISRKLLNARQKESTTKDSDEHISDPGSSDEMDWRPHHVGQDKFDPRFEVNHAVRRTRKVVSNLLESDIGNELQGMEKAVQNERSKYRSERRPRVYVDSSVLGVKNSIKSHEHKAGTFEERNKSENPVHCESESSWAKARTRRERQNKSGNPVHCGLESSWAEAHTRRERQPPSSQEETSADIGCKNGNSRRREKRAFVSGCPEKLFERSRAASTKAPPIVPYPTPHGSGCNSDSDSDESWHTPNSSFRKGFGALRVKSEHDETPYVTPLSHIVEHRRKTKPRGTKLSSVRVSKRSAYIKTDKSRYALQRADSWSAGDVESPAKRRTVGGGNPKKEDAYRRRSLSGIGHRESPKRVPTAHKSISKASTDKVRASSGHVERKAAESGSRGKDNVFQRGRGSGTLKGELSRNVPPPYKFDSKTSPSEVHGPNGIVHRSAAESANRKRSDMSQQRLGPRTLHRISQEKIQPPRKSKSKKSPGNAHEMHSLAGRKPTIRNVEFLPSCSAYARSTVANPGIANCRKVPEVVCLEGTFEGKENEIDWEEMTISWEESISRKVHTASRIPQEGKDAYDFSSKSPMDGRSERPSQPNVRQGRRSVGKPRNSGQVLNRNQTEKGLSGYGRRKGADRETREAKWAREGSLEETLRGRSKNGLERLGDTKRNMYNELLRKAEGQEAKGYNDLALGYYLNCYNIYDGDEKLRDRILALATSAHCLRDADYAMSKSKSPINKDKRKIRKTRRLSGGSANGVRGRAREEERIVPLEIIELSD